jgi:general stress protein YciG
MANKGKGAMTVREAGQKGGETTKERYGEEFYEQIGRRGGKIGGETPRNATVAASMRTSAIRVDRRSKSL